jgi:hypothetical protein
MKYLIFTTVFFASISVFSQTPVTPNDDAKYYFPITKNGTTYFLDYSSVVGVSSGKFVDGTDPLDAVYTGGNVGIGTSTPDALLDVEGGASRLDSTLLLPSYGLGNKITGSYSYVLAARSDSEEVGEFPLSSLVNYTYANSNNGVDLQQAGTVVAAALKIGQLPIEASPSGTLSYMAIETSASGVAKKILLGEVLNTDTDFNARMATYNNSLEVVEAATPQAAQTASTSSVGEEFWWRITGETGLTKMRKE